MPLMLCYLRELEAPGAGHLVAGCLALGKWGNSKSFTLFAVALDKSWSFANGRDSAEGPKECKHRKTSPKEECKEVF
jgi:hypothetical protein